ncbi:hypothetical protein ZTR_05976 [Talaromyces verruculosus]|nr:hypothetical protein ZTR_05976 [Talaromyces verruculosus]
MDIFGTTVTAITEIYWVTIFIKGTLAEYGMLAAKHGMLDLEPDNDADTATTQEDDLKSPSGRIQRVQLKNRTFDWALFGKKKLTQTLTADSGWTERLRQTMSLMLLTLAAFDKNSIRKFTNNEEARNLGMQHVARRQLLAKTKTPANFSALQGRVIEDTENSSDADVKLAIYMNEKQKVNEKVVVEYRKYSNELIQATNVAPTSAFHITSEYGDPEMIENSGFLALPCLRYIDQPGRHRFLFVYRLPSEATSLLTFQALTLHSLFSGNVRNKPPLGNRFFMAHALASTVLNIDTFGLVHKSIWSRGVIMLPSAGVLTSSGSRWLTPYLTGWGIARAVMDGTELAADNEIEPNFYRHPKRQGKPEDIFDIEHDLI